MALQGTLKDFSITEIIQLIGQQLKTGVLKIRRANSVVEISFVDGMIIHVYSNYRGKKDLIGEILVKAQLITQEQLDRVLRIQKETLKYLGEILVELQLLTKEDIIKVILNQIYETVYDLFWWEDGTFNFDLKLVESYKKIPLALSTEQVLLNILRMVDEWSEIEKNISSPYLVFQRVPGSEGKSEGVLPSQSYLKEKLTSEQELVYGLVDGVRSVQDIIDRSLLGKFNASETLVYLLEMGLIEPAGIRTPSLIRKVSRIRIQGTFLYYGAFVVLLFLFLVFLKPKHLDPFLDFKIKERAAGVPTHLLHKAQVNRIKDALEIYSLEKGSYPSRLEELVKANLVDKKDLSYRKGVSFKYELKDGKYVLKR